jgi:hypothetical protein
VSETLVAQSHSFLVDGIDLKALHKNLKSFSKEAVETLVTLLKSNNHKIKLQAAQVLLNLQVTVAKEISDDQIQRLVAEIKVANGSQGKIEGDDEKNTPLVDFTNIRGVD